MTMIYFRDWPNKVRKIWYGDNDYCFSIAASKTKEFGFEIKIDQNLQFYIEAV